MKRRCPGSGRAPMYGLVELDPAPCSGCGQAVPLVLGLAAPHSVDVPPEPKKRKKPNRYGKKALREAEALGEFRGRLRERAHGECDFEHFREVMREVCGTDVRHPGAHAHHIWPSDRDRGVHDPDRGIWLCAHAHAWVHAHPERAVKMGLLARDGIVSTP